MTIPYIITYIYALCESCNSCNVINSCHQTLDCCTHLTSWAMVLLSIRVNNRKYQVIITQHPTEQPEKRRIVVPKARQKAAGCSGSGPAENNLSKCSWSRSIPTKRDITLEEKPDETHGAAPRRSVVTSETKGNERRCGARWPKIGSNSRENDYDICVLG